MSGVFLLHPDLLQVCYFSKTWCHKELTKRHLLLPRPASRIAVAGVTAVGAAAVVRVVADVSFADVDVTAVVNDVGTADIAELLGGVSSPVGHSETVVRVGRPGLIEDLLLY